jgi:hypothetical protein
MHAAPEGIGPANPPWHIETTNLNSRWQNSPHYSASTYRGDRHRLTIEALAGRATGPVRFVADSGRTVQIGRASLTSRGDTFGATFTAPDWGDPSSAIEGDIKIGDNRIGYVVFSPKPTRKHFPGKGRSIADWRDNVGKTAPSNPNEGVDVAAVEGVVPADNSVGAAFAPEVRQQRQDPITEPTTVTINGIDVVVGPITESDEVARTESGAVVDSDEQAVADAVAGTTSTTTASTSSTSWTSPSTSSSRFGIGQVPGILVAAAAVLAGWWFL